MRHLAPLLLIALSSLASTHAAEGWPDISRPPDVRGGGGSRDAALVIGIEDYAFAQDIPGARENALAWMNWLKEARRVPLVKPLLNEQATKEGIAQAAAQVAARVQPGGRLWLIYIGHGAPAEGDDEGLLIGVDAQQTAQSLAARGLPRSELLLAAQDVMPPDSEIVMVQDACFSGKTSRGDLAPGLAPLKVVSSRLSAKTTVLAAARGDQYAGPLSDGTRPAFSYLVLGALMGWGDRDQDGEVTAVEAVAYADDALIQTVTGRSQTPALEGRDVTLGRSGRAAGPDLTSLAVVSASAGAGAASVGQVQVELGGQATDFAALAAQAAAAAQAKEDAERAAHMAESALEAERRRRLSAAVAEVQSQAERDYAAIAGLVANPTPEARPVLEAWLARYSGASVTFDGVREPIEIPAVPMVKAALDSLASAEVRQAAVASAPSSNMATLRVTLREPASRIYVDGKFVATGADAGWREVPVAPGEHVIEVRRVMGSNVERRVEVAAGELREVSFSKRTSTVTPAAASAIPGATAPGKAVLIITLRDPTTRIYLDGKLVGKGVKEGWREFEVTPGEHFIEARPLMGPRMGHHVDVVAGQTEQVTFTD